MFDVCKRSNASFACINNYWPKALIAWPSGRTLPSRGWWWRGEGGVESSSEKGQRHVRLYNSSRGVWTWWNPLYVQSFYLRDLHIHLTLREGWFCMEDIIQFAYKDMSSDIAAFLESNNHRSLVQIKDRNYCLSFEWINYYIGCMTNIICHCIR